MSALDRVPLAERPATGMRLLRERFGLEIQTLNGEFHWMYGSAEQLVATGLIRSEWLPGTPGNQKINQRVKFVEGVPVLPKGPGNCAIKKETAIEIERRRKNYFRVSFHACAPIFNDPSRMDFVENEELVDFARQRATEALREAAARTRCT